MNNIKWYYEAKSQSEIDYLLKYCKGKGLDVSSINSNTDFEDGFYYVGMCCHEYDIYATRFGECLIGQLTTDIEVFKAQFKTEKETETKADLIAQRDALNERIAEMEANEPCVLSIVDAGGKIVAVKGHNGHNAVWVAEISSDGKSLYINNEDFDIKEQVLEGNNLKYTFHKKQS